MAIQPTINAVWAEKTVNKQIFTEQDIELGIPYKGPVVSNQLNGIGYALYNMLDFVQRSGGYYNATKKYNTNDIVAIARKTTSTPLQIEYYKCKNVEVLGLPPIKNANVDETYSVNIYNGGIIDSVNWERLSSSGDGSIIISRDHSEVPFDTTKKIQFLIPNDVSLLEYNQQMNGGKLKVTIYFGDSITTFDLEVKQKYVKTYSGRIQAMPNNFNQPVPELEISNVFTNVNDYGLYNEFHALMPHGMRFEVGKKTKQEGGDEYFIFLQTRDGLKKIVVEGYCNGFEVSLTNEFINTLITTELVIPIKEKGGALCYQELGSMVDYDVELTPEQMYKKGLYGLNSESATTLNKDLYSMLFKTQGQTSIPAMAGRFKRNQGRIRANAQSLSFRQNQESGVPNISGGIDQISTTLNIAPTASGALTATSPRRFSINGGNYYCIYLGIDASRASNKYKNGIDEVVTDNIAVRYYYKAF